MQVMAGYDAGGVQTPVSQWSLEVLLRLPSLHLAGQSVSFSVLYSTSLPHVTLTLTYEATIGYKCTLGGQKDSKKTVEEKWQRVGEKKTRCSAIAERPRCRVRYSFRQK